MSTTGIIAEIVLVGLEVLVWVTLLALRVSEQSWSRLDQLKDWVAILALGLLGVSYMLGLVFTAVFGGAVVRFYISRQTKRPLSGKGKERDAMVVEALSGERPDVYIRLHSNSLADDLQQLDRQAMLLAATLVNSVLIGIGATLLVGEGDGAFLKAILVVGLTVVFVSAAARAFASLTRDELEYQASAILLIAQEKAGEEGKRAREEDMEQS